MTPVIHPPCAPTAICLEGARRHCHPTGPPCPNPERCLKRCRARRAKPCPSAVSIMKTRSKHNRYRKKFVNKTNSARSVAAVERFLIEKRRQERLKEIDATTGTRYYERYMKKKARVRSEKPFCQGNCHRGRRKKKKYCTIL